jgi:thiamine-monophosphate kinase
MGTKDDPEPAGAGSSGPAGEERTEEFAILERLRQRLADPTEFAGLRRPLRGEVFSGDDAAVLTPPDGDLLFAVDLVLEGNHFDLRYGSLGDAAWKAVAVNVSDIAAMGGEPLHVVVGLTAPPGTDLEEITTGLGEAAASYGLALVGGDLAAGPNIVIAVAITGRCPAGQAVLRTGARAGDELYVTGPLGSSAAGLTALAAVAAGAAGTALPTGPLDERLVAAYRRPVARLREGLLAARLGATAMIDVSDGLTQDLGHLAAGSNVGVRLETVPVAAGASLEQALSGGEDYELVFTLPPDVDPAAEFSPAGLREPIRLGTCVEDPGEWTWRGAELPRGGWSHSFG